MQQTVRSREQRHEGAELLDAGYRGVIHIADLRFAHDVFDHLHGLVDGLAVRMIDDHLSVVIDIDLHLVAGVDDLVDHLSARADDILDLVGLDEHHMRLRRIRADIRTRLADGLHHVCQDLLARALGLRQRLFEDLLRDAFDLDVHLHGRDALLCAGHLEVHVAEVILHALNIGQYGIFSAFLIHDQAHGDAGHRRLDRHAGRHQRHRARTDGSLGRRTVGFEHFCHGTDCIWELLQRRQHLQQCALAQRAMPDLTASRAAHAAGLAHGIRREVIVMHEPLALDLGQIVDDLIIIDRT